MNWSLLLHMKPHQSKCASFYPYFLSICVTLLTVQRSPSLNDVEEENEDEGIDGVDDDSVEDAFEASESTEAELQRDRDLVGNEDVRADRYCRLNVAQVQDPQQIIQVLALIEE
ncbi:hypothetical protein IV203_025399 [Nitzschia inconspicua]|uniref:Uncharacterized protein n=1 Tax=Nitzschia inconspicua TaxID=303405 RepID=A0A9K3K925_9STRA|nr:hypothetical protein IV203_024794 [Nitzschia inconspicua]KAG7362515.1 hypothetical protein IV203_025399 [Nitzschia inconspicua]